MRDLFYFCFSIVYTTIDINKMNFENNLATSSSSNSIEHHHRHHDVSSVLHDPQSWSNMYLNQQTCNHSDATLKPKKKITKVTRRNAITCLSSPFMLNSKQSKKDFTTSRRNGISVFRQFTYNEDVNTQSQSILESNLLKDKPSSPISSCQSTTKRDTEGPVNKNPRRLSEMMDILADVCTEEKQKTANLRLEEKTDQSTITTHFNHKESATSVFPKTNMHNTDDAENFRNLHQMQNFGSFIPTGCASKLDNFCKTNNDLLIYQQQTKPNNTICNSVVVTNTNKPSMRHQFLHNSFASLPEVDKLAIEVVKSIVRRACDSKKQIFADQFLKRGFIIIGAACQQEAFSPLLNPIFSHYLTQWKFVAAKAYFEIDDISNINDIRLFLLEHPIDNHPFKTPLRLQLSEEDHFKYYWESESQVRKWIQSYVSVSSSSYQVGCTTNQQTLISPSMNKRVYCYLISITSFWKDKLQFCAN